MIQGLDQCDQSETASAESQNFTVTVSALFDNHHNITSLYSRLQKRLPAGIFSDFHCEQLPDIDWEQQGHDIFQPIQCAESLWICPVWHHPPDPQATNIYLNSGLAFGTGLHPTTYLCMQWLGQQSWQGVNLLDYGCGSGILSIGACKLGATHAHAVDIDDQAVRATRSNAELNHLAHSITVSQPESLASDVTYDVVVANITTSTLLKLGDILASHVKQHGRLLISGILNSERQQIINHYAKWFTHKHTWELDGWNALELTLKRSHRN